MEIAKKPSPHQIFVLQNLLAGAVIKTTQGEGVVWWNCNGPMKNPGLHIKYPTVQTLKNNGWIELGPKENLSFDDIFYRIKHFVISELGKTLLETSKRGNDESFK